MDPSFPVEQADVELAWDELLEHVDGGRIVPIVGPGLLLTTVEGQEMSLERILAERLAARLARTSSRFPRALLSPDESPALVAGRWLSQGGSPGEASSAISDVLKTMAGLPVPPALRELAEISSFNMFVTLTFDSFLEVALTEARATQSKVITYNYSLRRPLPSLREPGYETSLLYLFGQASRLDDFAITEEDLLEYAHSVVSQPFDNRRKSVLDEVRERNLLIVGADLPHWLSRFFLRFSKRYRLWMTRSERLVDFIADHTIQEDIALTEFLKTFSNRHVLFPSEPTDFIHELHRRWTGRGTNLNRVVTLPATTDEAEPQPRIFLSYASEDKGIADSIKAALNNASLTVWLDREELESGDTYESKIQQAVRNAALFVPVLSPATAAPGNRWFRKEWAWAVGAMTERRSDLRYVCPVVFGDVPPDGGWIPEPFKRVQWATARGNEVPDIFVTQLKVHIANISGAFTDDRRPATA